VAIVLKPKNLNFVRDDPSSVIGLLVRILLLQHFLKHLFVSTPPTHGRRHVARPHAVLVFV